MNDVATILPEFDREMANARKVLERVPEQKLDWQAHPKSHTIGWIANHLVEILCWVEGNFMAPAWDFALIGGEPYQAPKLTSRQEILDLFDRNVAAAWKAIAAMKDDQLPQPPDPPSCDLVCLSPPERYPGPRDVRPVRS